MRQGYILTGIVVIYFIGNGFYLEIEDSFLSPILSPVAIYIFLCAITYLVYFYTIKDVYINRDKQYEHLASKMGSFPNFYNQKDGLSWSPALTVKKFSKKGTILIDHFKFSHQATRKFNFLSKNNKYLDFPISIDSISMTEGSLAIGKMGSGKTEFLFNILNQEFYNRAVVHDTKGDFVERFYNHHTDIIVNPYDSRGTVWDIFEEAKLHPFIGEIFFDNFLKSISGNKKDFFTASAKNRYFEIFNHISTNFAHLSSKEKWQQFIDEVENFITTTKESKQNSEKDVVSTMILALDFFKYNNYLMQADAQTFTISSFLQSNKKLFLLNKKSYDSKLKPYFSGFYAAFINIFLSQEDTKKDFTLFLLDEYLTLIENINTDDLTGIHTMSRSKGGMLFPAIQYIPKNDKREQLLLNSISHWYIFETVEPYSTRVIIELFGKCTYVKESLNTKVNTNSTANKSTNMSRENLISDDQLKKLSMNYQHITYHVKNSILYLGYTKRVDDLITRNEAFIPNSHLKEYLKIKEEK